MFNTQTIGLIDQVSHLVNLARPYRPFAKRAQAEDRTIFDIWYDPLDSCAVVRKTCPSDADGALTVKGVKVADYRECPVESHWCGLALNSDVPYFDEGQTTVNEMLGFYKRASEPTVYEKARSLLGWDDRYYKTNPVAAMLATGVLGAGLGYGGASLASMLLPRSWDKSKFRRTGLLLGGAAGAAPGAIETIKSLLIGQPVLDGSHMKLKDNPPMEKEGYFGEPLVSGDDLMKMTWEHPLVSNQLNSNQKMLITGAVSGASAIAGSPFFTPSDMGRLVAGMGSGYGMGIVAGKVLGALTGMPSSSQETVARAGLYAGALKAVTPLIYGIR